MGRKRNKFFDDLDSTTELDDPVLAQQARDALLDLQEEIAETKADALGGYLLPNAPPEVVAAVADRLALGAQAGATFRDALVSDLAAWKRKAIKAVKAHKSAAVRFESAAIPPDEQARIRAALEGAQSAGDVVKAFGETRTPDLHSGAAEMSEDFDAPLELKAVATVTEELIDAEWDAALDWAKKAMEG